MNVLVYVNFFVVHVLSKYKRQKRCLNLLKLEKNSFIIPFLRERFKTKEGAIPFGHTLDTTRPCILFKLGLYTNISIE